MKKFELTSEFITNIFGTKLFRIKALCEFGNVKAGELGGFLEKEENLSNDGDAWVYGNASVSGDARVSGDAWVYGNARVSGNASVSGDARVSGNARVYGDAEVSGDASVSGNARVYGDAEVSGNARVSGNAEVSGDAWVYGNTDYATAKGFGSEYRNTTFFRGKDGDIKVVCGCFYGNLEEFRTKVKETHKDTKKAKEYLMLADLMEYRFSEE